MRNLSCIDTRITGTPCCGRFVKCCSDGTQVSGGGNLDCPNFSTVGVPCLNTCPNLCCDNTAGVLAFIYRCDKLDSSFNQALVVTCPPPPE